jgi:hypothetical protein
MTIRYSWSYDKRTAARVVCDHPAAFLEVEFDEGNESELARHGISALEAWQVLAGEPVWARNKKGRAGVWLAVGMTDGGRRLTLPVTYDAARRCVRPVTGWQSTRGEVTRYG